MVDVDVPARRRHGVARRDRALDGCRPGPIRDDLVQRKGDAARRESASGMKVRDVARVRHQPGQLDRHCEGSSAFDHHASTGDTASVLGHHREVDCLRCRRDGGVAAAGDGGDSAKHCQHENLHARLIEDVTRPVAMVGHGLEPLNRDGAKNA